jgi:hypothetical protein
MSGAQILPLSTALIWSCSFILGPRFRTIELSNRRYWLSLAAGISISYVFIGLLPEMSEMQHLFYQATDIEGLPFPEYRVFSSALVGFLIFYSIENTLTLRDGAEAGVESEHSALVYASHISGFAIYGGLMAFLLNDEGERTQVGLLMYGIAMLFHFVIVDHSMRHEHGEHYDQKGRWIIVAAIMLGWLLGLLVSFSETWVPTLMGFVGGGVIINSIKDEMPKKGEGQIQAFLFGAVAFSVLLMIAA